MRMKGLTLERIPSAKVPFYFFLVAPWFGVLAAIVALFNAQGLLANQWNPTLFGVTYLITLGFITMVRLGALFQLLPVLSGESIPAATTVSRMMLLVLIAGLTCLASGFVFGKYIAVWIFAASGVPAWVYGFQPGYSPLLIRLTASSLQGYCCRTASVMRKFLKGTPADIFFQTTSL